MAIGSKVSAESREPAWVRWVVPSVGDVLFVALLGLLVFTNLSTRLLGDAGIGWHIRTGQLILSTHSVPHVDPFSSSMHGQPWFAWEWLYDVLAGWLESTAGLNGVVLFTALIIAAVFSWTFRLLVWRGTNVLLALVLVLLAASAAMIHFLARPHVVSWLFTIVWFWILESSEKSCDSDASRTLPLWLLPSTILVWVNVHGGFLVGFVLLGIYWACAAWEWLQRAFTLTEDGFEDVLRRIRAGRRFRALTLAGFFSAAATLVNPYGFRLHVHIYRYLSNRFLMNHIDEFQSPNFHYVAQKCFAGLLLLTLVAFAVKRRETTASQSLVVLFAVYAGLYASRNIPVSALLLILIIGPWLSDAMERLASRFAGRWDDGSPERASKPSLARMQAIELSLRGHLWPVVAIVLTCWVAAHGGKLGATPLMEAHFDAKRFPAAAVNYLDKQKVQGPLLSPDSWGGYLIFRLYPQIRVVVDDRHDFYGEDFLKSYLKMVHLEPDWQEFIQQYRPACVVVPKNSAVANILLETSEWQATYSDEVAVVFQHKELE
ncbi:MAG: hypothetical protein QOF56_1924 [Acidobacteriaceae bacterium]|jgi:hypothetical protein|nr:hypothetical protein [Acidobacteriaceae bacterium]